MNKTNYEIVSENGLLFCELTGNLLFGKSTFEFPCTGDWVIFQPFDDNKGIIVDILPRTHTLYRRKSGTISDKQAIASHIDKAFIVQSLDYSYYLDDNMQEAGLFIRRNIFQTGLVNALGSSPNIIGNRTSTVNLYASTGKISQTKLLYDILEKQNNKEQTSAILLADENLLVPLLQSLPDVNPNITTGYPLTQSPIYGILDLWMEVHLEISQLKKNKISYQTIETFINHPLTQVSLEDKLQIQKEIADKQLFEIALEELHFKSALPQFFVPIVHAAQLI